MARLQIMARVYLSHSLHPGAEALLHPHASMAVATSFDAEAMQREAYDADVVITRAPVPSALIERAPRLRAIIRHGSSAELVPMEAATNRGVLVSHVPGASARSVAEHAIFGAMTLLRRFRTIEQSFRHDGWFAGRAPAADSVELGGRTIGIIGLGPVGRAVQSVAAAFGMRTLITTRARKPLPKGSESRPLEDLLAESDIVVVCCSLTDQTLRMIDAERLALMRREAILINVARGPIVVEAALIEALKSGALAGAVLDVFETQPLAPSHPLFGLSNVVLTPTIAGTTAVAMERQSIGAAQEAVRILGGDLPANLINEGAVEIYRRRFG